ncbi:MAG: hypothetical protein P8M18_08190 [Woeseiaceae bacterium]|nr:hypothetical protein [Woeseiaceae bacterium]
MKTVRLALVGVGNVGQRLLTLIDERRETLSKEYQLDFLLTCVADSSGVAMNDSGFELAALVCHKASRGRLAELPEFCAGLSFTDALERASCDILLETSPLDLETGDPGLANSRAALQQGMHVVLANKSPLALAHSELLDLAAKNDVGILYSATFCGGLPVLNVIRRDMVCGNITRFRGIFNGTTNFMLAEMLAGNDYASALQQAQDIGAAEADPSFDVGGWDTAAKLVIAANQFCDPMISLPDVDVTGIKNVSASDLQNCRQEGKSIKLVASAELIDDTWGFKVEPKAVPTESFLGSCNGWEMGVVIDSDIFGKSFYKLREDEPIPTAASVLRDAVHLATGGRQASL